MSFILIWTRKTIIFLKFHVNNSSYIEISTSFHEVQHFKALILNKYQGRLLKVIRYYNNSIYNYNWK